MNQNHHTKPDYIFEISWEVCNKVGGIYTVVSTKAPGIQKEYGDNFILIGPDVWKETRQNPYFTEDPDLLRSWRKTAESEGLRIKIGRWNIKGNPIVILVDFTMFFSSKDKIFAQFWETYKLDSITGNWDYVEPALFGYAAGKVVQSYYEFYLTAQDTLVAQFHEWMTGAGVLYLRNNVPQAGCVFTTHATVVGRSIAGNNLPLYSHFDEYDSGEISRRFNILAKHSLEMHSALVSDAFTTVSEITARECVHFIGRVPDVITPNGFDEELIPEKAELEAKRESGRKRLLDVARAVLNQDLPPDSLLLVTSGRYEFRNKGVDLLIKSLGNLNRENKLKKPVVAFILIPAHHYGPVAGLNERIGSPDFQSPNTGKYLTHGLFDPHDDIILNTISECGLNNSVQDNVKVIFVPSYLVGTDGVINIGYYDLLPAFDLSVFPSYYEPWGYTPLESLAYGVPTVTTSLAGFGLWARKNCGNEVINVIDRNDENAVEVTDEIVKVIRKFDDVDEETRNYYIVHAIELAKKALWTNLESQYRKAYAIALQKVASRAELYRDKRHAEVMEELPVKPHSVPEWKKVMIRQSFPPSLEPLNILSYNLWWSWNSEAVELFYSISPELWKKYDKNPIPVLNALSYQQLRKLESDKAFIRKMKKVYADFEAYMDEGNRKSGPCIAYFSMEFGLHDSLQIYSGGLGILAGDYLKQASDSNTHMIGIGLLYRYGYFKQLLSPYGEQISQYNPQRFNLLPISPVRTKDGNYVQVQIALPGRNLIAKVWRVDVGRVPLYLLDTDIDENHESDRTITHQLYGGDLENRFKQELLLGVGGIRLIEAIGANPDIYHCNEGHAAFIGIERLRIFVHELKFSFAQAMEIVRSSSLFTTHTPVPAGHDAFPEDILRTYIPHYAERLKISWNTFMNLGRYIENKPDEKFSMSVLAARLMQEMNGVSRIHGRVTRAMFKDMYDGFFENELHIDYVTNGVHLPTWAAHQWKQLYKNVFGDNFLNEQSDFKSWQKIENVEDQVIWDIRQQLRGELIDFITRRYQEEMSYSHENPKHIIKIIDTLDRNVLTIGFARRFATYKRAHLLFSNLERLSEIVNNQGREVQFIFAGKAHPADKAGADLIKRIIEVSRMPQFVGKIIFLENYGMDMAKKLVQGVDVWMNTPTRPLEASGTSGEKAIMNGVLNLSVLDGWWAEGYIPGAGWALKEERVYQNQQFQDELDAETIYNLLEDDIVPTFYDRGPDDVPHKWVSHVKKTISDISPHFTMKRMLDDYHEKYYNKLFKRTRMMRADDYLMPRKLAKWKMKVARNWETIELVDYNNPDSGKPLNLGDSFNAAITLKLGELSPDDVRVELVAGQRTNEVMDEPTFIREFTFQKKEGANSIFTLGFSLTLAGVFDYAVRITPKNQMLPHRLDFNLVKWA
ncbi:MAG TPA: alpha-glucan family phosphorylase [Bacteroidales bacterium]|nr:alpha-glucan family phosphorylase [Bacteroidales bacterium]HPT02184.1 alpha-glucan family phosphorylase [Bacteroidales bacterium]